MTEKANNNETFETGLLHPAAVQMEHQHVADELCQPVTVKQRETWALKDSNKSRINKMPT